MKGKALSLLGYTAQQAGHFLDLLLINSSAHSEQNVWLQGKHSVLSLVLQVGHLIMDLYYSKSLYSELALCSIGFHFDKIFGNSRAHFSLI